MKNKFLQEIFTYFWIPVIISLVLYIFNQLKDVLLGIVVLIALSSSYVLIRLYFVHRKWWLLTILMVVILGAGGYFFLRSPTTTLTINGNTLTGISLQVPGGTVAVRPAPQSNGKYTRDAIVTLTATPAPAYDWKGWTGTGSDASNPTTVTMDGNKEITVVFEARASLIINNQVVIGSVAGFPEGSVSVSPVPDDDGHYSRGAVVTLLADPDTGYDWKRWSGTDDDAVNPTTATLKSDKRVTVVFEPRFSLIIGNQLVIGSSVSFNEGSVTVNPLPGPDDKYARGSIVTLTAVPATGYGWKNWSGTGADISNPTQVTVTSDKHVTVTFEQRFLLTVNSQALTGPSIAQTGGVINVSPGPGTDGRFSRDAIISLTATATSGYRFGSWSGDVTGSNPSVTIPVTGNRNVNAAFIRTHALAASVSPEAGGSVTPTGGTYDEGVSVTLTAAPAPGYRFDHWSGDASGSLSPLNITMNGEKNITAHFRKGFALTVTANPAAGGSITPGSGIFDAGDNITLTAAPGAGFRFDHWSGAVSGNTTTVSLTMNEDKAVTASFVRIFTLTLLVTPAGGGTVSGAGGVYDEGMSVTLTPTPAAGFTFDRWIGDVTGDVTNPTITITMDGNKTITARFKTE